MNQCHRVLVSFDHELVIDELTQAGVLPREVQSFAEDHLRNNDRHINIGHFDFRKSGYLLDWMWRHRLIPDRMGIFISSPSPKPTIWHRDGPKTLCAVNIPWFGTEGTTTEWCSDPSLQEHVVMRDDKVTVQRIEGRGESSPTEHVELHGKAIGIDTYTFHRVNSSRSSSLRGILSVRFPNGFNFKQLSATLDQK